MSRMSFLGNYLSKTKQLQENVVKWRQSINFELPEKYKGGRIEKWALYWKNLLQDYGDVVNETVKDIQQKPVKALIIFSGLGLIGYCSKNNPDEDSFRDRVLSASNDVLLLGESVRNNTSTSHLVKLEQYYNAGVIRRLNLGIFSLIWYDNNSKTCNLYETRCTYLKPKYRSFNERVVDIGFLNRWWILDEKMNNFDVNNEEWK